MGWKGEGGRQRGWSQEIRKGGISRVAVTITDWGALRSFKQDIEMICFRVILTVQLEDAGGRKVDYRHDDLSLSERHQGLCLPGGFGT